MKIFTLFLSLVLAQCGFAAIASTAIWEMRKTGSNTNGAFWVPGAGTDYSQQDAPVLAVADVVADGSTTLTSVTGSFTSDMANNGVYLQGGSGSLTATRRQITAYNSATSITVDAVVAAGTGITGRVGGAGANPDDLDNQIVSGNTIYVKYPGSGQEWSITTAWTCSLSGGSNHINWVGYDTTRSLYNKDGNIPLFNVTANSTQLLVLSGALNLTFRNISFKNSAVTTRAAFTSNSSSTSDYIVFERCIFDGFSNVTTSSTSSANVQKIRFYGCEMKNGTSTVQVRVHSAGFLGLYGCYIHSNTGSVVTTTDSPVEIYDCIIANNTSRAFNASDSSASSWYLRAERNIFYKNGTGNQFEVARTSGSQSAAIQMFVSNIVYGGTNSVSQGGTAVTIAGRVFASRNAFGGYSGSAGVNFDLGDEYITLGSDPFVDGVNGDFRINANSDGGVLLKEAGWPNKFGSLINYRDVGALQHQDAGTVTPAAQTSGSSVN
jgi:hypothetical protein